MIRYLGTVALALSMAVLAACGDSFQWEEEVRLPDGRVVIAKRYQEFKGPSELGKPPTASDYSFTFRNPDTDEVVKWASDRTLAPVALSVNAGTPELVTTFNFDGAFRARCPDPPFYAFRYSQGNWERIELVELKTKVFSPNLTMWNVHYFRPKIAAKGHRWTEKDVAESLSTPFRGHSIDLRGVNRQTFGDLSDCDSNRNWWILQSHTTEPSK